MDRHAEQAVEIVGRSAARRGFALAALLLTLTSGCVSSGQVVPDLVASPAVTQVAVLWNNQLMTGVDPVHHGAPLYGLGGRVFLFGPGLGENLAADGQLVVELYALLPEQPQGPPALLETWEIKKDILNAVCLRKDGFGAGYTLNLPWEHYRPDVTQFEIRTRYEPTKGATIYSRDLVMLRNGANPEVAGSKRVETGDRRVITAAAPPAGPQQPPLTMPAPFVGMQPAMYQGPQPAGTIPARPPVPAQPGGPMAPGAVQPALYQVPGQSPYQPQPTAPFPGAGQR